MADAGRVSSPENEDYAAFCERPGHPGPYMHHCPPRCASVSATSGDQCHKDEGHDEHHWVLRDGQMEVWDA